MSKLQNYKDQTEFSWMQSATAIVGCQINVWWKAVPVSDCYLKEIVINTVLVGIFPSFCLCPLVERLVGSYNTMLGNLRSYWEFCTSFSLLSPNGFLCFLMATQTLRLWRERTHRVSPSMTWRNLNCECWTLTLYGKPPKGWYVYNWPSIYEGFESALCE